MLMEVRNNIRYFFNAIKVSIKSAMAYKAVRIPTLLLTMYYIYGVFLVLHME